MNDADRWPRPGHKVVVRCKGQKVRLYFRGDAAFARPEMYEYLEAEGWMMENMGKWPSGHRKT